MLAKLQATAQLDFERGFTAFGPHREDFIIALASQPANSTASRGEVRSLLLALKIIELGLVEQARRAKPLFLLDDVFSELDSARRRALVKYLKKYQAIITTTDADAVMEYFSGEHTLISLSK
jgi:DNA replication and repair protein RecF